MSIAAEMAFLGLHSFVELSVGVLMWKGLMPAPYDEVFSNAHSAVRGFCGGGAASTGVIGVLTMADYIPRTVGLAFCGGYQLFIALNESYHEMDFFDSVSDAKEHIVFGVGPHLVLGVWGIYSAWRHHKNERSTHAKTK